MTQIVAGEEAVQLRKFFQNQRALLAASRQHLLIDAPFRRRGLRQRLRQRGGHRPGIENIAAKQHRAQPQHMIGGFTVDQRALARGVGIDHPA